MLRNLIVLSALVCGLSVQLNHASASPLDGGKSGAGPNWCEESFLDDYIKKYINAARSIHDKGVERGIAKLQKALAKLSKRHAAACDGAPLPDFVTGIDVPDVVKGGVYTGPE
jgi:hypothetical protein